MQEFDGAIVVIPAINHEDNDDGAWTSWRMCREFSKPSSFVSALRCSEDPGRDLLVKTFHPHSLRVRTFLESRLRAGGEQETWCIRDRRVIYWDSFRVPNWRTSIVDFPGKFSSTRGNVNWGLEKIPLTGNLSLCVRNIRKWGRSWIIPGPAFGRLRTSL